MRGREILPNFIFKAIFKAFTCQVYTSMPVCGWSISRASPSHTCTRVQYTYGMKLCRTALHGANIETTKF